MRIDNDGVSINVVEDGRPDGPVVLFLHGIISCADTWNWAVPDLVDTHRVLRMEFRGHGDSDRAPGTYGFTNCVADAIAVLDQLVGGPAVLVGHSLGGGTAAAVAQTRPDLVTAVLLEDPAIMEGDLSGPAADGSTDAEPNALLAVFGMMRQTVPMMQAGGVTLEALVDLLGNGPGTDGRLMKDTAHPDAIEALASGLLRLDATVLDPVLAGVYDRIFDPHAPIPAPGIVLAGDSAQPDTIVRAPEIALLAEHSPTRRRAHGGRRRSPDPRLDRPPRHHARRAPRGARPRLSPALASVAVMTAFDGYDFDRFLRYDELSSRLQALADENPGLVELESYGTSYEGRNLWLVTVTDSSTGGAADKPAHWVDANIHATEVTGSVAALHLVHHLVEGFRSGDERVTEALRTRTFYVVPRVNPDGAEAALADSPSYHRSSVRPWPWQGHRWPGIHSSDVDGDGRVLTMRVVDPDGAWVEHPDDRRVMVPIGLDGTADGRTRYRLVTEGEIVDHDGFTIPTPNDPLGLDMNRNFPAGWGTAVHGSGDHPLSEPEIDALVRAVVARPNICGYNAYHTFGGVLLRPSSTKADAGLPPLDVWTWTELGKRGTELTGYKVHSVYEDFTWDKSDPMSGAADDWAYEHLGVFGWTTEFWDVIAMATGERAATEIWYVGPTTEQELAVATWADEHAPGLYVDWYSFDHPQLGAVEIGGPDWFHIWSNPPGGHLKAEVAPHAEFAVYQALASPRIEILLADAERLGDDTWRVRVGVANTGWLPTYVTEYAKKHDLVQPLTVSIEGAEPVGAPARVKLGQLAGRQALRINGWALNDGTADRALHTFVVRAAAGSTVTLVAEHPRAGRVTSAVTLG